MLGIIGAMDVEVELLKKALGFNPATMASDALMREIDDTLAAAGEASFEADVEGEDPARKPSVRRHAGMVFYQGCIGGTPCVVVKCGIGMVNAAACAQALVDLFGADAIINTGIAGSLDASIDICDIVVGTGAVNHRMDARGVGYEEGQTPEMEKIFPCDEAMGERIADVARKQGVNVHRGVVASGDIFVADDNLKAHIAAEFDGMCAEMEGAAIAQVCAMNGVPCAIVRAISDKADGSSVMDYPEFEKKAAHVCAALIEEYAKEA